MLRIAVAQIGLDTRHDFPRNQGPTVHIHFAIVRTILQQLHGHVALRPHTRHDKGRIQVVATVVIAVVVVGGDLGWW